MKQKRKKNKFPIYAAVAIIVVLAAVLLWLWLRHKTPATSSTSSTSQTSNGINYGPPTQAEKQESQNSKNQAVQQNNNPASNTGSKKQVTVDIIGADRSGVRAQVTGVFENGGTCTATATSSTSPSVTATSTGFENVSYTNCTPIQWSLGSGPWTITVTYSSADASGTSQPYKIQ